MKKILLIAYHFHPDTAVGALRTIKYAKYLPQFGWEPQILTIRERLYPTISKNSLDFDVPIHRTGVWPIPDDIYRAVKKALKPSGSGKGSTKPSNDSRNPVSDSPVKNHPPSSLVKFVNSLSNTPDPKVGWYLPGLRKACRLIREHKFDAIYTSGPPHSTHLIGLQVHRRTSVPWVMDFRDPWHYKRERDSQIMEWTNSFDRRYERITCQEASLITTTTDEWRDYLKKRFSPNLNSKCHTIINGYDEDDFLTFRSLIPEERSNKTIFFHGGTLYVGRDPSAMLQAAGELIREGKLDRDKVEFQFYGNVNIDMRRINSIISEFDLSSTVIFAEPVQRDEYMQLLASADVLVLFQSDAASICVPAKTFEYLATGKQVLNLSPPGATRNLMSRFSQTASADPEDVQDIKHSLIGLVSQEKEPGRIEIGRNNQICITKKNLTKEFAKLLDRMTESS